jgi:hypothetical protein
MSKSSIVALRITGSTLLIVGYFVMLNVDVFWGVIIRLIANAISLPWVIRNKVYDLMLLIGFFMAIEFHKFMQLIVGS